MEKMFRILFFLLIMSSFSQTTIPVGTWSGDMEFYPSGLKKKLEAEIFISPLSGDSVYQWRLIYIIHHKDSIQKDIRNYELHIGKDGRVWMDEKNSILIHGQLLKNKIVFLFDVNDVRIFTQYYWNSQELTMEHVAFSNMKSYSSGGTIMDKDTIPSVTSYKAFSRQWAIMHKKKHR